VDNLTDVEFYNEILPSGMTWYDYDLLAVDYSPWFKLDANNGVSVPTPTYLRGLGVTGSLNVSNTLTASLSTGYTWVGNGSNISTLVATSSFASTGSNTFNGTQTFSGSVLGNVVPLSITSNTASMDLNVGNYFTLTLADTATTHITATNIKAGLGATLVITTGTNSSASLAPILKQPSGNAYTASYGASAVDVLSLVSIGTTSAYVVSTKNMI
jgi:hypothetical protein